MRSLRIRMYILHLLVVVLLASCGAHDDRNNAASTPRLLAITSVISPGYKPIVQQLYISYFGRPADTGGLASFQEQLVALKGPIDLQEMDASYRTSAAIRALVDSFGSSAESAALYSGDNTVFVTAIYRNLLNRSPDASGLAFWVGAINSGSLTRANASLSIMAGALSNTSDLGKLDAALIQRKVTIGSNFTDALVNATVNGYSGDAAAAKARAMLANVTATTDIAAFQSTIDALITDLAQGPPPLAVFAGQYTGTYAGEDAGTVSVTIAANGVISGSGRSTLDPDYQFIVAGQVAPGGLVSLTGSGSAGTARFNGTVTVQGVLAGTWSSPEGSGTFSTQKASSPPVIVVPPGESVISGIVSIGPVSGASVRAYAIAGGTQGSLLGSATTNASGYYSVSIKSYSGPILLEALGGHYTDPATGVVFELTKTLRSATVAGGAITANITPITEAAVINASNASGGLTAANVSNAVLIIKNQIGFDPVTTTPIDPTVPLPPTATTNNMLYGAQIGTVSQYLFEDQTRRLPNATNDFAQLFATGGFTQSQQVSLAANNYGANDRNVNGLTSTLGSGTLATCSWVPSCTGPNLLPLCVRKPEISCIGSKVAINGVCVIPNTSPVVSSATTLSKSWSGPWNWSGPTAGGGCHVDNGGLLTMNLTQTGTSFSGTVTAEGIRTVNTSTCVINDISTRSGTVKGTISAQAVDFTMTLSGTQLEFIGKGTLSGGVFSGSMVRVTGGSGSFNLH
jgi:hypothetical protein